MPWRFVLNALALLVGLLLLERGADWFIDAIAVLVRASMPSPWAW
jgi:hypothetical protein